jgi:drug/metabolite transporter (DMT)-like permease
MYYGIVIISVLMFGVQFYFNDKYQKECGQSALAAHRLTFFSGLVGIIILLIINGFKVEYTHFTFIMGLIAAVNSVVLTYCGFKALDRINLSLYSLFLMLGGMTIPYFFGLIYLNEEFSLIRLLGLVLMAVSIVLSGLDGSGKQKKGDKTTTLFFILCITVFFLNGFTSITSKVHQLEQYADVAVTPQIFVLLTAFFRVLFFSIVYLCIRLRERHLQSGERPAPLKLSPGVLGLMLGSAAIEGAAFMLQLIGAVHLPATVLYPLITGGVIILTALAGRILFQQKLSRRAVIGILLCFASTFLFL